MEHRANQNLLGRQAPRVRRTLLMFLAFVYLFVGLAHTISCVDDAVAATISIDMSGAPDDGSDEGGSKQSPIVAEHCYVCAPVLMPVLAPVADPSAHLVRMVFVTPKFLLEDHPRLDTPPPKHLT